MDIKKANVNLLLGKVGELLKGLPDDAKKGDEFSEAEKALAKLQDLFADKKVISSCWPAAQRPACLFEVKKTFIRWVK